MQNNANNLVINYIHYKKVVHFYEGFRKVFEYPPEFLACKTVRTRACILVPEGGNGQLVFDSQLSVYILSDKWLLKWSGRTWFQVWRGTRKPRKTTNNMFLRLVCFVTWFGLCFKPWNITAQRYTGYLQCTHKLYTYFWVCAHRCTVTV